MATEGKHPDFRPVISNLGFESGRRAIFGIFLGKIIPTAPTAATAVRASKERKKALFKIMVT